MKLLIAVSLRVFTVMNLGGVVLVCEIGETGARSYRGRLLQGHFMQNYYIDGEIADSSSILIHQGNY